MHHRKHRLIPYGQRITSGPVGSVLCNLYRGILGSAGIDSDSYSRMVERASQRPDKKESTSSVLGLGRDLMRESITWKMFLKGLAFLKVGRFEFTIAVFLEDGRELHYSSVHLMNQISTPGSILSTMFRALFGSDSMDISRHSNLMTQYLNRACIGMDRTKRAAVRAGLVKELFKPAITWKSFIKGMVYLSANRLEIKVLAYPTFGRAVEPLGAREVVNLSDFKEDINDSARNDEAGA